MTLTDLQHGAEKAIVFTILGMIIKSHFTLRQSVLKTTTIIAGVTWFFNHDSSNNESLIALSIIGPIHIIHEAFFGETEDNNYYE